MSLANQLSVRQPLGQSLTFGLMEILGRSIVTGSYEHTDFPTEAELVKLHGVSRSVTREAVKMLTAKGLVSARPKQGTIVMPIASWNLFDTDVLRWMLERKFSLELLRHFDELRIAIEAEAAALAAEFAGDDDIAAITAALERMTSADVQGVDTLEAHIAFHIAVLHASHNPFYSQFQELVRTALRGTIQSTKRARYASSNIQAHMAVRDAILRGRVRVARMTMRKLVCDPPAASSGDE